MAVWCIEKVINIGITKFIFMAYAYGGPDAEALHGTFLNASPV